MNATEAALSKLLSASRNYRYLHDHNGSGDIKTGRAWDLLRRAEDEAEKVLEPTREVTVCDHCLCASCWKGDFYCDKAVTSGTTTKTVAQLEALKREHPSYWEADND